jgi:hypothetical protein
VRQIDCAQWEFFSKHFFDPMLRLFSGGFCFQRLGAF